MPGPGNVTSDDDIQDVPADIRFVRLDPIRSIRAARNPEHGRWQLRFRPGPGFRPARRHEEDGGSKVRY